jgi:hypothetical protein
MAITRIARFMTLYLSIAFGTTNTALALVDDAGDVTVASIASAGSGVGRQTSSSSICAQLRHAGRSGPTGSADLGRPTSDQRLYRAWKRGSSHPVDQNLPVEQRFQRDIGLRRNPQLSELVCKSWEDMERRSLGERSKLR